MDGNLWNIGIRVADVEKEVAYFMALGAVLRVKDKLTTNNGQFEYALLDFGGTRLFLTPRTVFEHALPEPLRDGLTHAVFEVNDVDATLKDLVAQGTEVLIAPMEIDAGLGSRRLAFCRTPGGVVFEIMQVRVNALVDGAAQ
ncbi:MAG TPA: VOC family protein [Aestuariivirgaceae bacterium]|nr:VOC family protein [Aestuariivirgaceae bacterium]